MKAFSLSLYNDILSTTILTRADLSAGKNHVRHLTSGL